MGVTKDELPALQVIVLGSGGGPLENNVTAFLVRATASGWNKGSIMGVDGGVGLAAIVRLLDGHKQSRPFQKGESSHDGARPPVTLIDGPFEGLEIPNISPEANARYMYQELIDTVLITHPHMDHIMGAVTNTSTPGATRQKRLVGLPDTIEALKAHIFNSVIWPNLTDENGGAGLVSYIRLVDGGSPASGQGDSKGYVEVGPGLGVKTMSISHGTCIEAHAHRGSTPMPSPVGESSCLGSPFTNSGMQRNNSNASANLDLGVPRFAGLPTRTGVCVYNSSVFFIRDSTTGKEILIFGDVEPDSDSLSPRNCKVWGVAAPKIAAGRLTGIFIECSYVNSREDDQLFGHMKPELLIRELKVLAGLVSGGSYGRVNAEVEHDYTSPKRKRNGNGNGNGGASATATDTYPLTKPSLVYSRRLGAISGVSRNEPSSSHPEAVAEAVAVEQKSFRPLNGLKIVIIHVKENLTDGPSAVDIIRKELRDLEEEAKLGCEFILSHPGQSLYF